METKKITCKICLQKYPSNKENTCPYCQSASYHKRLAKWESSFVSKLYLEFWCEIILTENRLVIFKIPYQINSAYLDDDKSHYKPLVNLAYQEIKDVVVEREGKLLIGYQDYTVIECNDNREYVFNGRFLERNLKRIMESVKAGHYVDVKRFNPFEFKNNNS